MNRVYVSAFLVLLQVVFAASGFAATDPRQPISWQKSFDDFGRTEKMIDPAGRETLFSYQTGPEGSKHIARTSPDGGPVNWYYDQYGRLLEMTDEHGTLKYGYDASGRPNQVQRDSKTKIAWVYDTKDRATTLSIGNDFQLDYVYDFLDRLKTIKTPQGDITYEYGTGQGMIIRTLPSKVQTIWEFGANGKLHELTHHIPGKQILAQYSYEYRSDGLIAAVREQTSVSDTIIKYEYDMIGRLVKAVDQQGKEYAYQYDEIGNCLQAVRPGGSTQEGRFDWGGRLVSSNNHPCTYDEAGNLSSATVGSTPLKFQHNSMGRLISVNNETSYKYDGDGRLIERRHGTDQLTFVPDPLADFWQPLAIEDNTGNQTFIIWDNDTPLVMVRNGEAEFMLHDHLGSVRLVLDDDAEVKRRLDYGPFGVMKEQLASQDFAPRYAGLFWDKEAQAYLTLARAYVPELGRFLGPDPQFRLPDDSKLNHSMFEYCGGDPVNYFDRDGAEPQGVIERDSVVGQLVRAAFRETAADGKHSFEEHAYLAWEQAESWRSNPQSLPIEFSNQLIRPSANELRLLENRLYSFQYVITGKNVKSFRWLDTKPGKPAAAMMRTMITGWSAVHVVGEKFNIGPNVFLKRNTESWKNQGEWLPQTQKTIEHQNRGINDALKYLENKDAGKLPESGLGEYYSHRVTSYKPESNISTRQIGSILGERMHTAKISRENWNSGGSRWGSESQAKGLSDWDNGNRVGITSPNINPSTPSTVGGVYLGGSGQTLDGLGLLEGLTLDSNNNFVLLSKEGQDITLPPLRIDDVVTIFRSVYIYGEGPTVSIDPVKDKPREYAMNVVHGHATEDTYVGWILFEADRLMKGYTIGVDNNTLEKISSSVEGYDSVRNILDSPEGETADKSHWERFWIVPAKTSHFGTEKSELTIFDVPLEVRTQTMKMVDGDLVDDPDGASSEGAAAFVKWFTRYYEAIAMERSLTPPPESGITKPVAVFSELQRIALITAIAEKLRDQGTTMPFWMRDYEVKPVPFTKTTPGLQITRSNMKVFGGVQLSPKTADIKQFTKVSDLQQLPQAERERGQQQIQLATDLSLAVTNAPPAQKPLELHVVAVGEDNYQTLSFPGPDTRALAPCQLEEVDLTVQVAAGCQLQLVRNYNSFFDPAGIWGKTWTLNLPKLQMINVPGTRESDSMVHSKGWELLTPLNSIYARFDKIREVPELDDCLLQVPDSDCEFFGLVDAEPSFITIKTLKLLCRNGDAWHFAESGNLAAIESRGFRTIYLRDAEGTVTQIAGVLGDKFVASIDLQYDRMGRLTKATGTMGKESQSVSYDYNTSGKLAGVAYENGNLNYQYSGPWVTKSTWHDQSEAFVLHQYEYNDQGQLLSDTQGESEPVHYVISPMSGGKTLTISSSGESEYSEQVRYDKSNRPVEASYANGSQTSWAYPTSGETIKTVKNADGEVVRVTDSADRRSRTYDQPGFPKIQERYDASGRLMAMSENGVTVLEKHYHPTGELQALKTENTTIQLQYNQDGLVHSLVLSPPMVEGQNQAWQKTEMDPYGRPVRISDYSHQDVSVTYDENGNIQQMVTNREGKNWGYIIDRNNEGQIQRVKSSWSDEHYTYDDNSDIKTITMEKPSVGGIEQATLQFDAGKLIQATQFDGGKVNVNYLESGIAAGLPSQVTCANGLDLSYEYNSEAMVSGINIGSRSRIKLDYDSRGRVVRFQLAPALQ